MGYANLHANCVVSVKTAIDDSAKEKLWQALETFPLDDPGVEHNFTQRLARRNKWDVPYAAVVVEEYRKFLYLIKSTGLMQTPSLHVDEAWHLHLNYTKKYWEKLCRDLFNEAVHHHPGDGTVDSEHVFEAVYERTLQLYIARFGEPPFRVWGRPNPKIDWQTILEKLPETARPTSYPIIDWMEGDDEKNTSDFAIPGHHQELWSKLQAFVFDIIGVPKSFSDRVAVRNNWPRHYALRVTEEYRKFLYLRATLGKRVSPPTDVDEAWHIHMLYTKSYWVELCQKIMGEPIHHKPGTGSIEDQLNTRAVYAHTYEEYVKVFGQPPDDIWPKPHYGLDWRSIIADLPGTAHVKSKLFHLFADASDEAA